MKLEEKIKPARRAPVWASVPDEKWNDWRWQLSNRLNSVDELNEVIKLTVSETKALTTNGLFRVDITPYFASLMDPDDLHDPIRQQVIPTDAELGLPHLTEAECMPTCPWVILL